jgi:hypothetical protein
MNIGLYNIVILVFLHLLRNSLSAQTETNTKLPLSHDLNFHVGKLIKIHGEYPQNDISSLIEYNFSRKLTQQNSWHTAFSTPSAGISIIHAQFGNQEVLGQALGVIPNLRFEKWKNQTRFSIRAGFGLAWFNKPFHVINNPDNLVIGTRLANMSTIQIGLAHPLGKKIRINLGASFTHCSDAHVAVPNIGANLIAGYVGLAWCNRSLDLAAAHRNSIKKNYGSRWAVGVSSILGLHEFPGTVRPTNGPRYLVVGENIFIQREFHRQRIFSIGLNHHQYQAYREYLLTQELFDNNENMKWKSHSLVFFLGYEWCFGKISLYVQAGANLYAPFIQKLNEVWDLPKNGLLYRYTASKLGYRFHWYNLDENYAHTLNPFISVAVKTNGGTADFLEFSLGTIFNNTRPKIKMSGNNMRS